MSRYCPLDSGALRASAWAWLSPSAVPTAFHEMCRDEYVMLMMWKKAAAGEIIYNKCPPNASGEGRVALPARLPHPPFLPLPSGPPASLSLHPEVWSEVGESSAPTPNPLSCPPAGSASRRCLLSAQGVAYWGLPSFARCISHEYRYLYLSVSAPCWAGATQDLSQTLVGVEGAGFLLVPMCLGVHTMCPLLPGCASPCLTNSYSFLKA